MRSAPASSMAWAALRSRTPPAAFTPISGPTTRRMSATSAAVAPPGPKPVDVLTKSAPAARAITQAFTFSSSVRSAASMMTFTSAPPPRLAGRLGLEERVIDAARDVARVEVRPRLQAEAGGALAQHPAHPVGTAPAGRGVTGARRLLLVYELRQHRPHDRVDEVAVRHLQYVSSMALIFFTRRACLSSVQFEERNVSTISRIRVPSTNFAPRVRTLASLCSRALRAAEASTQSAARTPGTLLAAMAEPMPAPSTRMPIRASPA